MAAILQQLLTANLLSSNRAMAEGENVVAGPEAAEEDKEEEGEDDDLQDEPSSSRKDGGDDDDDDEDGPSLVSRKITSMAAQAQPATRSAEGEASEGSQP